MVCAYMLGMHKNTRILCAHRFECTGVVQT